MIRSADGGLTYRDKYIKKTVIPITIMHFLPSATYNLQPTTYNLQPTTYNLQPSTSYSLLQLRTYNNIPDFTSTVFAGNW